MMEMKSSKTKSLKNFFFFDARHEKLLMTDQVFLSLVGKQHRKRNWVIS